MYKKNYAIVFDLDETLGHFSQPYKFWNSLKKFLNTELIDEIYLYSFFDLFPEFFRINIFKILKFIKKKKISGYCDYVMIYTNNNGPNYWVNIIQNYIHKKLKYKLFDQIIRAFKINGKTIEICRTTYGKSYKDLLSCTKLPYNTQICFIDDQLHAEMNHDNVWYIYIQPYIFNLEYEKISKKYYKENISLFQKFNKTEKEFFEYMKNLDNINKANYNFNKSQVEKNIDLLISKKLEKDIHDFIVKKSNFTKKNKKPYNNITRRN
tara:strand:+ start:2091 stop:2885 length:795 start_codon:yes stop_codon:yes gene_type:complete